MSKKPVIYINLVSLYFSSNKITGANKRFFESCRYFSKYEYCKITLTKGNETPCFSNKLSVIPDFNNLGFLLNRIGQFSVLWFKVKLGSEEIVISDYMPIPHSALKKKIHLQVIHDIRNFTKFNRSRYGKLAGLWQCHQWKKADYLLTVSEFSKKEIVNKCGVSPEHIIVSPNGVDEIYFSKPKITYEKKWDFLYIATFEERKNHEALIDALYILSNKGFSFTCLLVGRDLGILNYIKEKINECQIEKYVNIRESVGNEEDLIRIYDEALAYVMPSVYEGFGIPLIEALARGCLVVSNDLPVFREVCDKYAEFVDVSEVGAFSEKLAKVLEYGDTGYPSKRINFIRENYSWPKIFSALDNKIRGLLPAE